MGKEKWVSQFYNGWKGRCALNKTKNKKQKQVSLCCLILRNYRDLVSGNCTECFWDNGFIRFRQTMILFGKEFVLETSSVTKKDFFTHFITPFSLPTPQPPTLRFVNCNQIYISTAPSSPKTLCPTVEQHNIAVVRVFLANPNIDVNEQNRDQLTSLHRAALKGYTDIVEALLGHPDIDLNAIAVNQRTPLHCAAWNKPLAHSTSPSCAS